MYLSLFQLQEHPFRLSPDPNFLFLSKQHARALAYVESTLWFTDGFVVITGEIGCGKTTLLRCFNRINERYENVTTTGTVSILGKNIYDPDVSLLELRKSVGMVFQRPNPLPLTIRENVLFGYRLHTGRSRIPRAERDEIVGLLLIDVTNLRRINMLHGHHAGDVALAYAQERMRSISTEADNVFRIGSHLFAFILPSLGNPALIGLAANRGVQIGKRRWPGRFDVRGARDELGDFALGVFLPGDIGEGHLGVGLDIDLGLALADCHQTAGPAPLGHAADEEEPDDDEEQGPLGATV